MDKYNENIEVFALTDCHQEARKLCSLFSGIMRRVPPKGRNTLICDSGDLFKGIYDKELCVESYLELRRCLPEAKIVLAVGNNDFGFNRSDLFFLQNSAKRFNQANIHVLCANLFNIKTGAYPKWVDPYILLNINNKKVLVTSFCISYIKLQRYGLQLINPKDAFARLENAIKHIAPDLFIVLNHDLLPSSLELWDLSQKLNINIDLLIGGHEHSPVLPIADKHIYYPQAFCRNMLHFSFSKQNAGVKLDAMETIGCKDESVDCVFAARIEDFENKSGLTVPVAASVLDLERSYSDPGALGTFVADQMKIAAKTKIAMISTGYMTHALRYEAGKMLTMYNIERAFSAEVVLQKVVITAAQLKAILDNALRNRYTSRSGNTRFLQCSGNMAVECRRTENDLGEVTQIIINGEPLLNAQGKPLHQDELISCALDPFIGAGEQGFDVLRSVDKETIMRDNQLVKIKDLFIRAIREAPQHYKPGSSYPAFRLTDV